MRSYLQFRCRSFCPAGAGVATTCTAGIYFDLSCYKAHIIFSNDFYNCESGNYCPIGSAAMVLCPAGTWGSTTGLQTALCSGQCTAGILPFSLFFVLL